MMTLSEFIKQYTGKSGVGNTPENMGECVGVSSLWMDNFNIAHVYGNAADLYKNAPTADFTKIPNTPDAIVQAGDIVIWGKGYNGTYGHTGVATGTNTDVNRFDCFQQNDPLGSTPHIKNYNYAYVTGWLRPKSTVIPQDTVHPQITDQTKLPILDENGNQMEVQALRSRLADLTRDNKNLMQSIEDARMDITKLQSQSLANYSAIELISAGLAKLLGK